MCMYAHTSVSPFFALCTLHFARFSLSIHKHPLVCNTGMSLSIPMLHPCPTDMNHLFAFVLRSIQLSVQIARNSRADRDHSR
jgi:hypothetical protein